MKMIIALMLLSTSAFAQQLPTGPLQFIKDKKTVNVSEDTVNPLNTVGLPISGTIVATNPSVSGNNAPIPLSSTLIGASDGGQLRPLSATTSGGVNYLKVDTSGFISIGAATSALQTTGNSSLSSIDGKITTSPSGILVDAGSVTIGSSVLPSGASTETTLSNLNNKVTTSPSGILVDAGSVTIGSSALPSGASTETTLSNLNNKVTTSPSGILVDAGSVTIGSSALPSGASTETTLSNLNNKVTTSINGILVDAGSVTVGSSALPSGAATETTLSGMSAKLPPVLGAQITTNSMAVNIASDQVVNVAPVAASTGSGSSAAATVSTVITLTAPANATGFVLMNLDTSTANVRYAIGRTASATLGQQLQPGRDSGFIPCSANVSLIAESGTQNYDIQWIIK